MHLGIVGSEEAKFDAGTRRRARAVIRSLIRAFEPERVVSGGCHLGGIDIWAEELAGAAHIQTRVFKPRLQSWEHYKARNLLIAQHSDVVVCIVPRVLPASFTGRTHDGCYHCRGLRPEHVKSGGCWTVMHAPHGLWVIVEADCPPVYSGYWTPRGCITTGANLGYPRIEWGEMRWR